MEGLHRRDQASDKRFVGGGYDFISYQNLDDVSRRNIRPDVVLDPNFGGGEISEFGDFVIRDGDGNGNASMSKCPDKVRVGVKKLARLMIVDSIRKCATCVGGGRLVSMVP